MPTQNKNTVGKGTAYLLNLSPQWYNAYRVAGRKEAVRRDLFLRPLTASGRTRRVEIENGVANRWRRQVRLRDHVLAQARWPYPPVRVPQPRNPRHGTGRRQCASRLPTDTADITLRFTHPLRNIRDERRDSKLPDGDRFRLAWTRNEAVVLSFDGP